MSFMDEAMRIAEAAQKKGIIMRLIGAIAFKVHCPKFTYLHEAMKRELTDIDFISYSKHMEAIVKLFIELNYPVDKVALYRAFSFYHRYIFEDKTNKRAVDVFFDKIQMCHTIDFKNRLEIDYPTIPLADMLLEKMQIVEINEKDIKDTIILLREHEIGDHDKECINSQYICDILSKDWGFFYTVTTNLNKCKDLLNTYDVLTSEDRMDIETKINKLLDNIEKKPKSMGWKVRAKIGTSRKWYNDVDIGIKH